MESGLRFCMSLRNPRESSAGASSRRSRLWIPAALIALLGIESQTLYAQSGAPYYDDTHEALASRIEVRTIAGSFGYERFRLDEPADGKALALDLRSADFIVANSMNPDPTLEFNCDQGTAPVNRYPVSVYYADLTALVGGLIVGDIPQEADWDPLYCNSAAILYNYTATSGMVDGVRITQAWDAIRAANEASGLYVKNSWISNVRDDVLENDNLHSAVFEDNLVDGAFQGISVHSGGDFAAMPATTVRLSGNVIRIREYLYKGEQRYGAPFKNEDASPVSVLHDNVIAVDYAGGGTFGSYWDRTWSKIEECSNNLFLWLSDSPIPSSVGKPPPCFTVITGQEARNRWEMAKQNWIDCHPRVARIAGDPASAPNRCEPGTFGGYTGSVHTAPMPPRLHAPEETAR